ncbi:MAG: zinc-ribbon domain-containing protein [Rhodopila sp.]
MQIACPGCSAEYEVPASRLTPGRSVRCARCNQTWKPEVVPAPLPRPEMPPPLAPELEPGPAAAFADAMQRLAASPAVPARRRVGLAVAWVASILVLAGAGAGIVLWREPIMRVWPPSGRILAWLAPLPQLTVQFPGNKSQ